MAITVQFAQTKKPRNSTKIPEMGESTQCLIKETCSIIRPILIIHLNAAGAPNMEQLAKENYCYIPIFQRYYYIVNVTSETAAIAYVHCEVDVLASFRDDILATPAFVMYSNSKYNTAIPDSRLPMTGMSRQWCNTIAIGALDSEGVFALTGVGDKVSGTTGMAATIGMNASMLQTVASKLYASDFWDKIKTDYYHPEEALMGCMWTPIKYDQAVGGGASTIKIGTFDIYTAMNTKRTVTGGLVANFTVPFTDDVAGGMSDYRNFEPYSKYLLTLPGVGTIDVPMKLIAGHSLTTLGNIPVYIEMAASPNTGDVTYNIKLMDCAGGLTGNGVGFTVKGNFGVEVPISRAVGRFGNIMQSLGGAASAIGAGAILAGGAGAAVAATQFAAGSFISNMLEGMNTNTNIVGSLGGWSVDPIFTTNVESKTINWDISDEPSAIRPTIGRPYFHHVNALSECSGIVQCTGAYVKTWATNEELEMISQYVNRSTNYIYGGIIIE